MKRIVVLLLAVTAVLTACQKNVKVPMTYTVETKANTPVRDVYLTDAGSHTLSYLVKFLGGYAGDAVTIRMTGLPTVLSVAKDSFRAVPTFQADFVVTTDSAPHGTYPVTLTTTSVDADPQSYKFNIHVVSANCASGFVGTLSGSNACTGRNYTYGVTATAGDTANVLILNNFGGYGLSTNTRIYLNCNNDSVNVPSQNIGNGTVLSGKGTYSGTTLRINYSASSIPGGGSESCNAVLAK